MRPSRGKAPWLDALRAWGVATDTSDADEERLAGDRVLWRRMRIDEPAPVAAETAGGDTAPAVARWQDSVT